MAKAFNLGEELKKAGVPTVDTREQIEYIPLERIDPDPENFYFLTGIAELADNIELVGLQQPLRVRDGERGHVTVVSGHRRRAACLMIRDSGSTMFERGVPCIREKPEASKEMQELRLIFANSSTRVMSAQELSKQAVRTRELLTTLRDQGYAFQGRTRELVASVLQTSASRVGRLSAIREKLVPGLLESFDRGDLGETVAYRLSQETTDVQWDIAQKMGPAVRELTTETAEKVIDQIKKAPPSPASSDAEDGPPAPTERTEPAPVGRIYRPQDQDEDGRQIPAPVGKPAHVYGATDGLKKYLDAREKEDRAFWKYMEEAADSLILHSFASGAAPLRKDNIDMLRLDCRTCGVCGFAADWQGSNKGLWIGPLPGGRIERTWTEVYDALAAIAITRWRRVLVEEKDGRKAKPKPVPTVDTKPEWQTGTPPKEGWYAVKSRIKGANIILRRYLFWNGKNFVREPGSAAILTQYNDELLGWVRLPDDEG